MDALEKELTRMGVTRFVVTWNGSGSRDSGVAVWFDRKNEDDFKWQDILGIENPYPTVDQLDSAYKAKVKLVHPDLNPGIDKALYLDLTKAREDATKWVRGTTDLPKGYVIPSDQWKEARQNLYAIIGTVQAFRRIQRLGATQLYEGTLQGFAGILSQGVPDVVASSAR
jgi:hypothetical protein